jgi:hypothetical protein
MKETSAWIDAVSRPRSWLDMSVETAASSGEPSGPPPLLPSSSCCISRRKISSTAGNHFFLSACTTFSQCECCRSLKASSSIGEVGGSGATLHSSRCEYSPHRSSICSMPS